MIRNATTFVILGSAIALSGCAGGGSVFGPGSVTPPASVTIPQTTIPIPAGGTLSNALAFAKNFCGFIVNLADTPAVQALINTTPVGTGADVIGNMICTGITAAASPVPGATVYSVVHGITIRGHFTAASLARASHRR